MPTFVSPSSPMYLTHAQIDSDKLFSCKLEETRCRDCNGTYNAVADEVNGTAPEATISKHRQRKEGNGRDDILEESRTCLIVSLKELHGRLLRSHAWWAHRSSMRTKGSKAFNKRQFQ